MHQRRRSNSMEQGQRRKGTPLRVRCAACVAMQLRVRRHGRAEAGARNSCRAVGAVTMERDGAAPMLQGPHVTVPKSKVHNNGDYCLTVLTDRRLLDKC